jgi:hypothetical protein
LYSGVNDTGDKLIAGIYDPPRNDPPPITENQWQRLIAGVGDTGDKFASNVVGTTKQFIAGVVDPADKHWFAIISANFREKLKRSLWVTQGLGEHWFVKKLKSKISCQIPFHTVFVNDCPASVQKFKRMPMPKLFGIGIRGASPLLECSGLQVQALIEMSDALMPIIAASSWGWSKAIFVCTHICEPVIANFEGKCIQKGFKNKINHFTNVS